MTSYQQFLWAGRPAPYSAGILVAAATLWNWLLYPNIGGVSLALAGAVSFALVIWATYADINKRQIWVSVWGAVVALLPLVIQSSFLAWVIAVSGVFAVIWYVTKIRWVVARMCLSILYMLPFDLATSQKRLPEMDAHLFTRFLRNWGVALVGAVGFGALFVAANPVLAGWGEALGHLENPIEVGRFWLFAASAMVLWPFTQLARVPTGPVSGQQQVQPTLPVVTLRNALILFNLVFAVQTLTDFAILSGGASLPEGMSMGEYVHRGAYPLLVTALLAGGFAVVVRRQSEASDSLKVLLLLWVGQTVLLVIASMLRLEAYISAYGLTVLRVWAAAWMLVVAIGLGLLMFNTIRDLKIAVFMRHASLLGAGALYAMSLVNVPATVARHNVQMYAQDRTFDIYYNCGLGPLAAHVLSTISDCQRTTGPRLGDWRQWDLRRLWIARSLEAETVVEIGMVR